MGSFYIYPTPIADTPARKWRGEKEGGAARPKSKVVALAPRRTQGYFLPRAPILSECHRPNAAFVTLLKLY